MLESARPKAEQIFERPVRIDFVMENRDFSLMEDGLGGEWALFYIIVL